MVTLPTSNQIIRQQLAGLSFEDFKARLKEHFSTGYILADETIMADLDTAKKLR